MGVDRMLAIVGVMSMIVQAGLVGAIVKRVGDHKALYLGFGFGTVAMVLYGLAPSPLLFVLGIVVGSLFGLAYPSLQALMTRQVGPDEQARLQGAIASLCPGLRSWSRGWC